MFSIMFASKICDVQFSNNTLANSCAMSKNITADMCVEYIYFVRLNEFFNLT